MTPPWTTMEQSTMTPPWTTMEQPTMTPPWTTMEQPMMTPPGLVMATVPCLMMAMALIAHCHQTPRPCHHRVGTPYLPCTQPAFLPRCTVVPHLQRTSPKQGHTPHCVHTQ